MRNLKSEAIQALKDRVGNFEIIEISKAECDDLIRIEDNSTYSTDKRIAIEPLTVEGQDSYDYNHFYAYDIEEDEVIGYFKVLHNKMKKDLKKLYAEWREISEEMLKNGYTGSIDCGEGRVREDFTGFAELEKEISFEEMFALEKEYNEEKQGFTTLTY